MVVVIENNKILWTDDWSPITSWFTPVDEKPKSVNTSDDKIVMYAHQHDISLRSEKPKKIEPLKFNNGFPPHCSDISSKLNEIIAFLNKE